MGKLLCTLLVFVSFNALAIRNGKTITHHTKQNLVELAIGSGTCTGVRISKDFILTAAHCFKKKPRKFTVRYINGKVRIKERIRFSSVIIKGTNLSEELAIVPINPPELREDQTQIFYSIFPYEVASFKLGEQLTIMGFGMDSRGSLGRAKIANVQFKQDYYRLGKYTHTMFLVEPDSDNSLACPGDSGGPIISNKNGVTSLVGIVSFISSTKQQINRLEAKEQCQVANIASYIPLNLHMDFLSRYLD